MRGRTCVLDTKGFDSPLLPDHISIVSPTSKTNLKNKALEPSTQANNVSPTITFYLFSTIS